MLAKYTCQFGDITLCVKETADPLTLDCRATHRPPRQALVIRVGDILRLARGKKLVRYVKARVFRPRLQYGRLVAGGLLEIMSGNELRLLQSDDLNVRGDARRPRTE